MVKHARIHGDYGLPGAGTAENRIYQQEDFYVEFDRRGTVIED